MSGGGSAAAKPDASPSPSGSASPSTPTPSPTPSPTPKPGSLSTTADGQGNASLLTPATKKLFDKLNCANPKWRTEIYGSKNPNNWDNPNHPDRHLLSGR